MKTFTTIASLLTGFALTAQTSTFQISLAANQPLSASFSISAMTIQFSPNGSNFTDALDQVGSINDPSMMYPYTVNSSYLSLLSLDSRPESRTQMNVPFGAWTPADGDMHVQGSWTNPGDTMLYDVTLIDNTTSAQYNLYNEVVIPVLADTGFAFRFTIRFTPKAHYIGFDESCFGQSNGSVYAQSPVTNWEMMVFLNNVYQSNISVAGSDTLLQNLAAGNYEFIYILNGVNIDTASATVSGPAAVVSAATPSNTNPMTNDQVDFTNNSTGAVDYLWDFGDGSPTTTVASPSYIYTTAGTYTVTLIAYNATGCDNTSTYTITVSNGTMAPSPQLQDRNNTQAQSTLRTSDITVDAQNGQANISSTTETAIAQYNVYSLNGQLIHAGNGNADSFTYDTPGIYVIRVVYADGTENTKRFMLN